MKDFYCFIHIEKCAGTTFSHSLKYNMPAYLSLKPWYFWSNEPNNYLSSSELKRIIKLYPFLSGIGGHTTRTYANYEDVVDKNIKYFTFLRDPIARYMSHFNHQVNKKGIDWTIESFINEDKFNNCITRRVAGSEDIDLALYNLKNHYDFIGLFESYDESLLLLNQLVFNKKIKPNYEFKNDSLNEKKVKFVDLSKEVQEKIIANNSLDIKLYKEVKQQLYPEFVKKYKGNLEQDLVKFKEENSNYKYNALRYNVIKATRLITEKIIEPLAHKKQ